MSIVTPIIIVNICQYVNVEIGFAYGDFNLRLWKSGFDANGFCNVLS